MNGIREHGGAEAFVYRHPVSGEPTRVLVAVNDERFDVSLVFDPADALKLAERIAAVAKEIEP